MNLHKDGISAVITTYNNSQYLKRSLNSLLQQNKLPDEIIIVDDGSNEYNSNNIKKIIKENDLYNIKYFFKLNGGPSSARNHGIHNSNYSYIVFLDVDDIMCKDNLLIKYNLLKKINHNIYFGVSGDAKFSNNTYLKFINTKNINLIGRNKGLCGSSPCYLFIKKYLLQINGFDEDLHNYEDFDLIIRLLKLNMQSKHINFIGLIIFLTKNSISRNSDSKKIFDNSISFLNKFKTSKYFTTEELNLRFKEVYLTYAKTIFLKNYLSKEFIKISKIAFEYYKPSTFREFSIYIIIKFIRK